MTIKLVRLKKYIKTDGEKMMKTQLDLKNIHLKNQTGMNDGKTRKI